MPPTSRPPRRRPRRAPAVASIVALLLAAAALGGCATGATPAGASDGGPTAPTVVDLDAGPVAVPTVADLDAAPPTVARSTSTSAPTAPPTAAPDEEGGAPMRFLGGPSGSAPWGPLPTGPRVRVGPILERRPYAFDPDAVERGTVQGARACYEAALRRAPGLAARVDVWFLVRRDGQVLKARIASSTPRARSRAPGATTRATEELERCLVSSATSWAIPSSAEGLVEMQVTYTFAPTSSPMGLPRD